LAPIGDWPFLVCSADSTLTLRQAEEFMDREGFGMSMRVSHVDGWWVNAQSVTAYEATGANGW
jgi:hypothetical protein